VKSIQVLEDAHHRQVLRQAGAVYQFRHAELQDHLAEIHRRHTRPLTRQGTCPVGRSSHDDLFRRSQ
jgi:hypothetical protein